jgi:3-isopropylmalate dehydratase small subunit
LTKVDESYDRIHYANSIVTGHLASVVKVHDAQNELLAKVGMEDLRVEVGEDALELSKKLEELLIKARKGKESARKLSTELDKLIKKYTE